MYRADWSPVMKGFLFTIAPGKKLITCWSGTKLELGSTGAIIRVAP